MANKANSKDITPLRDALNMEIMINQALIDLLVAKGIITQEELMAKIEEIRKELPSGTS
jgi:predicted transcriptional regulator